MESAMPEEDMSYDGLPPATDDVDWTKDNLPDVMRANADSVFPEHLTLDADESAVTRSSTIFGFEGRVSRSEYWSVSIIASLVR